MTETKIKKETEYLFFKESATESIISDFFSFLFLVVTFWFNYTFIDGNNYIDFLLLFSFISITYSTTNLKKQRFTNKKDLLNYINKEIK